MPFHAHRHVIGVGWRDALQGRRADLDGVRETQFSCVRADVPWHQESSWRDSSLCSMRIESTFRLILENSWYYPLLSSYALTTLCTKR